MCLCVAVYHLCALCPAAARRGPTGRQFLLLGKSALAVAGDQCRMAARQAQEVHRQGGKHFQTAVIHPLFWVRHGRALANHCKFYRMRWMPPLPLPPPTALVPRSGCPLGASWAAGIATLAPFLGVFCGSVESGKAQVFGETWGFCWEKLSAASL